MELAVGTEPRPEYSSFELAAAARKLVEDVMLTKPGENVVITADSMSDARVVNATANAAFAMGAIPTVVWYPTGKSACIDPPAPVGGAIERADVWIEYAVAYILYSKPFQQALANGARYICLTGMDVDMMVRTIGKVDYLEMIELGELLRTSLEQAKHVEVTSPAGTKLVAEHKDTVVRQSGRLADEKGKAIMLGGQIAWGPVFESINGVLVFDGALWPPMELGLLRNPVTLIIEKGLVKRVEGGTEARIFEQWLASYDHPAMYHLAHYSLGFNPGVLRPTGRIVEDERVFGCMEFGVGQTRAGAPSHTDGIVLNPTIILDGKAMEVDGVYTDPEARRLCRELGVPGY
jgi:leucyl aminopeptidase (aminopeptidase T)